MGKRSRAFFENFIVFAIILVLIQTFVEDLAVLLSWSWPVRRALVISGFIFDLIFSIEFIARLTSAISNGVARKYLFENRGWIDLLASIPLLLLNSGPAFFAVLSGTSTLLAVGGVLGALKAIKAIRIARILRLLRVLKIFRKIKHTDSVMAQRHSAKISTIAIGSLVFTLLLFGVIEGFLGGVTLDERYKAGLDQTTEIVQEALQSNNQTELNTLVERNSEILTIVFNDRSTYQRFEESYLINNFGPADYIFVGFNDSDQVNGVFFSSEIISQAESLANIRYFIIIIVVLVILLFVYSPHFAITVSDPIQVMRKGFSERAYNLEVKVPEEFADDEIFELGAVYNEVYLPLKDRSSGEKDNQVLDIKMDDIQSMVADLSDEQFTFSDDPALESDEPTQNSNKTDQATDDLDFGMDEDLSTSDDNSFDLDDDLNIFDEEEEQK